MTTILCLDPGTFRTAWLLYDTEEERICNFGLQDNYQVIDTIRFIKYEKLVVEMISSYGMRVGNSVFETCVWIGRFIQTSVQRDLPWETISRISVKTQVCGTPRSNDAGVRAKLIEKFGPPGIKKNPGGTYGISKDIWSALAVAVAWTKINKGN